MSRLEAVQSSEGKCEAQQAFNYHAEGEGGVLDRPAVNQDERLWEGSDSFLIFYGTKGWKNQCEGMKVHPQRQRGHEEEEEEEARKGKTARGTERAGPVKWYSFGK